MLGDLDHMGFGVIPDDILVGVGYETKENSLVGVGDQLGRSSTRRAYQNSAAKSAQG